MRSATIAAALVGAVTVADAASNPVPAASSLPPPQLAALSGIDIVPQTTQIEAAFGPQPFDDLLQLARDDNEDPGVRLRAYRALALYPGDAARAALRADIIKLGAPGDGFHTLLLRAMIQSLGLVGQSPDLPTLAPYLNFEASRDIRAATADALRAIGDPAASAPLRARLDVETSPQVCLAISEALRVLVGTEDVSSFAPTCPRESTVRP